MFSAASWIEPPQFRLLVPGGVPRIDTQPLGAAPMQIAHVQDVDGDEVLSLALASEVPRVTTATQALRGYAPSTGPFPTEHLPPELEVARKRDADVLEDTGP